MQGVASLSVTANGSTGYSTTATYSTSSPSKSALIASYTDTGVTNGSVAAVVATATTSAPVPAVSGVQNATIVAVVATATATAPAPSVAAGAVITGVSATATALGAAPVVVAGAMLTAEMFAPRILGWAFMLLLVVRPLAISLTLTGSKLTKLERGYIAWFGIRGIGSLYYLFYGLHHGLPPDLAHRLTSLTAS